MPTEKIYSRVTINGVDYINLENDTVTSSDDFAAGKYGHLNTGVRVLGTGQIGSGDSPTLVQKTITANGTYLPSNDNADGYNSVTVNVASGGSTPSATTHTIHFVFTDNTSTDITAYYDSTFISSAITATTPSMYDNKTVTSASLDGVVWYQPASIPLNTELVDLTKVTSGKYIGDDGLEHDNEAVGTTDYIRIDPTMTFSYIAYQWFHIGFYDSSKNVISTIYVNNDMNSVDDNGAAHGTLTPAKIPANAIYVRLCGALGIGNEYLSLIRTA